jgi:amino acid transporter
MILDYLLIPLLSVIYAALTANRLLPSVPYAVWAVAFSLIITAINIRGIRVTARAGNVMMVLMTICAALFVVVAARWVVVQHGAGALLQPRLVYDPGSFSLRPLMLGAAIASISYIGFDAISTLAEDTINPERDISIATVLVCVIQTALCLLTVYAAALVWPDFRSFPDVETAILDVGRRAGGPAMRGIITFVLLIAGLACALTGQAGASRLLYGMGRDGVLSKRVLAHLDKRYSTPTRSIYLMGAFSLVASLTMRFQMAVELLNFGAFVGFILVNLSVIRHYFLRRRERAGWQLFTNLIFPLCGAAVCSYVWINLSLKARVAGFCWLGIGTVYLAVLTRGFRKPPAALDLKEAN